MPNLAYGLWPSPITPAMLAQETRLTDLAWDSDGQTLLWLEGRSDRGVLVCASAGNPDVPRDLTSELSVRARVGYGGGDMAAAHGHAFFVSGERIYRQPLGAGPAAPITPQFGECAAPTVSPDGRRVLYVYSLEGRDGLAIVDAEGRQWPQSLIEGADFYMQPAWHPDGQRIAWIHWNHPFMPWDGTRLGLARLDLSAGAPRVVEQAVLAGDNDTAIAQPAFSPDGRRLAYLSDASGWTNLALYDLERGEHRPLVQAEAELAQPAWSQGQCTYGWSADSRRIHYVQWERGLGRAWSVDVASGERAPIALLSGYSEISKLAISSRGEIALIGSGPAQPRRLVSANLELGQTRVWARATGETIAADRLSVPQAITWPSDEGETVHGLYYPPAPGPYTSGGQPPAIVMVHGGPTSQSVARYAPAVQFFTTRGYAVLEVNYRGSSGYGRAYRNLLREQWGIVDSDDAASGARHLAAQGLADGQRLVIMGGSAGGYSVLQALIRYPHTFRAGICLYGVTNLFTLAADTHKFEQRYLDLIVGPLPETAARYRERSPIFHADQIVDPVAVFQGDQDRVVPPAQAETIVAALQRAGVPHEYHVYAGEGHGWRKAETIAEFYATVLRFLKQYVLYA
ncbi:MAG: prolyl oligopeptidase family serine peptidase [Chloroflexota bacterium]